MADRDINFTKEAFLNPWNLAFLIGAMLISFSVSLIGATWPFETILLFASAIELLYLGIVPRQERFRRAVRAQAAAEHAKPPSQKEIYYNLTKQSQRRYARLKKLGKEIQSNYRRAQYAAQGMADSNVNKINGLLNEYLKLLYQKERYEYSNRSATEGEVVEAIEALRHDMTDDSDKVRAIKQRRLKILEQRLSRFKKGAENLQIIEAQLETIEDVVKYIHEHALTLSDPQQITFQLDTLLHEVEETQMAVEELQDLFAADTDLLVDVNLYDSEGTASSGKAERERGQ